jgi:uncharacterized protein YdeI (YjbR/CyaY-like superfamily)
MGTTNPSVDGFLRKAAQWRKEMQRLREIVLACNLNEEVKWRTPCYTHENANVVLISSFKDYCALSFMKGALLEDPKGILVKPGANTRAARQIRFTGMAQINRMQSTLKKYIMAAVAVEQAGLRVDFKEDAAPDMPQELARALKDDPILKRAFEALTPGRRRWYILHIAAAKQSRTRLARIERCRPKILEGKGLNERDG